LFSIVEKLNNYVFEDDLTPTVPGRRAASYELCPLLTYRKSYSEAYRRFQGEFFWWGSGYTWEDLSMEEGNFPWRGSRIFHHFLKTIRN
jgi:hypothetical protein